LPTIGVAGRGRELLLDTPQGFSIMPTTINGIGTHYYGKKNRRQYNGQCESCGRQVKLSDYETGHYFVVIFVPLIPLGKKQIIGDCPVCRRHRSMPLKQWAAIREESLESGMNELAENMEDPTKALELLGRMTVFNQMDEAHELAAATAKQHADDFDTQIGLGAWYEQQGQQELSKRCFDHAIGLQPEHPTSKRIQGIDAIQAGKPTEAAKHFEFLRTSSDHYDPALFFMLATTCQQQGLHEQALAEFKDLIERNPAAGKDKTLRKAVKQSEKILGQPSSILPRKGVFG
jgi:tetratricopeptide (TPR) repeat protein